MKILFVTQLFTPEPFFKGEPFVKRLQEELGHEVFVLTDYPYYPGNRLYDGYKMDVWEWDRRFSDIKVLRTAVYPSHDNSALNRSLNYITFGLSTSFFGLLKIPPVDLVYVYHPPATVGLTALAFKLFRGVPFVYEIQDIWPDTLTATGMIKRGFLYNIIGKWCDLVYRYADKITVISPGFKKLLESRGVKPEKIEIIYNPCDESGISPRQGDENLAREKGLAGKFNILFAGNIGLAQALEAVLLAAEILRGHPKIQFVLVGGGVEVERLQNLAQEKGLGNVKFIPPVSPGEIGEYFALADVLLVHLKDDPLFRITIPGKTQAYMAAGKPVLIGVAGDAAELVERAAAGISCLPENPQSIADAVLKLYNMPREKLQEMGENGRKFYQQELSLKVGLGKLDRIFQEITGKRSRK